MPNDNKNKINRLYIFLLLGIILLSIAVITAGENLAIIKIFDINTTTNTTVEIPVSLENNETVYGIQFIVYYNTSGLKFVDVIPTSRFPDAIIEANDLKGKIKIAGVTEKGISPGKESILNLIFYAKDEGLYNLEPEQVLIADIDTQLFSTQSVQGIFTIKES